MPQRNRAKSRLPAGSRSQRSKRPPTGCPASASTGVAARAAWPSPVERVFGLEIEAASVAVAERHARERGLSDKVRFFEADSFTPREAAARAELDPLRGHVDFIVANPPASYGDDGFSFRREVVAGAREFLAPEGRLLLSISHQYGPERIAALTDAATDSAPELRYRGVVASSDWVAFDQRRTDLRESLEDYVAEEKRGGFTYAFRAADDPTCRIDARSALAAFRRSAASPLTQWQSHLFVRVR